jgi:hypothetical protein
MDDNSEQKLTRREMCLEVVRYAALGGMGVLWAGLYLRSSRSSTGYNCTLPTCSGCSQLNQCTLPQAEKIKNIGQSDKDENKIDDDIFTDGQSK